MLPVLLLLPGLKLSKGSNNGTVNWFDYVYYYLLCFEDNVVPKRVQYLIMFLIVGSFLTGMALILIKGEIK